MAGRLTLNQVTLVRPQLRELVTQWIVARDGPQQVLKTWLGIAPKGSTPSLSAWEIESVKYISVTEMPLGSFHVAARQCGCVRST
jgi:hypothetical protein